MDFFNTATEKIGEVFEVVTSTAEKAVNTGKKKYNIATLENKLNKCYIELGKAYYETFKNDQNLDEEKKAKINEAGELIAAIEKAKKEIEEL
jgi:hypothetical protein